MSAEHRLNSLKRHAAELGFSMVGVIPARPAKRLDAYLNWVDQEMYGKMGYLARPDRIDRRQDLNVILPGVKSMICVGLDYQTLRIPAEIAADPSRGRISNYAWGIDYHDWMTPRLEELANRLATDSNSEVKHRVYVDTGAILERDHAESAGFGFTGKNTMLIHPGRGSFFFLGEILTDLELPTSPLINKARVSCGSCTRCLNACPTNAFPEPYVLDARKCISYLTIELKSEIPDRFRSRLGNWVYGCDVCQEVCPFNRFAPESIVHAFRPNHIDVAAPPLIDLLQLDQTAFKHRFANSPIKRIKRERLVRNACIAAGNWFRSDPKTAAEAKSLRPLLLQLTQDRSPLVASHAMWALDQAAPY